MDDALSQDRAHGLFPAIPNAWAFPESSTAELARRLALAGEGATLTVVPYVKGGLLLLRLRVVPKAVSLADLPPGGYEVLAADDDINESRPCPPFTGFSGGG